MAGLPGHFVMGGTAALMGRLRVSRNLKRPFN
jgi:hypothetical protein